MKGSKYDDETREKALAMIAGGKTPTAAARAMGLPKSTVSHWWNTQMQDDEDVIALRAEARRRSIMKCGKIVDKALGAIDHKVHAAAQESRAVENGMAAIRKAAKDGVIALNETDVKALCAVIRDYTGASLRELSATMGDICKMRESLERQNTGGENDGGVRVEFAGGDELAV